MCENCAAHNHQGAHDAKPGGTASASRPKGGTPKVVAVCGKGGVGKTSISAMAVHAIEHHDPASRILVIDADPAVGLSTALGVDVVRTVDDIRNQIIDSSRTEDAGTVADILEKIDYEMFDAMAETDGYAFLAIGRPETEGCYCKVNDYLKEIIEGLIGHFDYVIIDGEAGIEQVNRRVLESVTHLLLVSDCSKKGLAVARTIKQVADGGVLPYEHVGLILSRVHKSVDAVRADTEGLDVLGCILEEDAVRSFDMDGTSLLDLPHDDPASMEVTSALHRFGVLD